MTNIRSRLDKLESQAKPGVIFVWHNFGETNDQAPARWKAEHPGRAQELDGAGKVYVIGWDYPAGRCDVTDDGGSVVA